MFPARRPPPLHSSNRIASRRCIWNECPNRTILRVAYAGTPDRSRVGLWARRRIGLVGPVTNIDGRCPTSIPTGTISSTSQPSCSKSAPVTRRSATDDGPHQSIAKPWRVWDSPRTALLLPSREKAFVGLTPVRISGVKPPLTVRQRTSPFGAEAVDVGSAIEGVRAAAPGALGLPGVSSTLPSGSKLIARPPPRPAWSCRQWAGCSPRGIDVHAVRDRPTVPLRTPSPAALCDLTSRSARPSSRARPPPQQ